jgi:hypothetical protein
MQRQWSLRNNSIELNISDCVGFGKREESLNSFLVVYNVSLGWENCECSWHESVDGCMLEILLRLR